MTESASATFRPAPSHPAFARGGDSGRQLTSERLDQHMAAFRAAGGKVEVLGNTPLHKPWRAAGKTTTSNTKQSTPSPSTGA